MKGVRVRIAAGYKLPTGWPRTGTVVGENDQSVGVSLDGSKHLVIVPKYSVGVLLT